MCPWVRIDDKFAEHPKVVQAGPLAMAMYVAGLCYCNRNGTDGVIQGQMIPRLVDLQDLRDPYRVVDELVEAGLWETSDDGASFVVHDYAEFQPTNNQRRELSAKRADAGRKGAAVRWADSSKHPVDVGKVIATCHSTLVERFDEQDVAPALAELRKRLETGESITSPVNFAANGAETHRRARMAAIRKAAEDKAARQMAQENAGLAECEHGSVRRACDRCRDAATDAIAMAKAAIGGGA